MPGYHLRVVIALVDHLGGTLNPISCMAPSNAAFLASADFNCDGPATKPIRKCLSAASVGRPVGFRVDN